MTIAYWCVLTAALLPYIFTGIAKAGPNFIKQNKAPREYLAGLDGIKKRAHWANLNAFEVFPAFAAAVIIAQQLQVIEQGLLNQLALAFIGFRVLHGAFYLADIDWLRSLAWTGGLACVIALFVLSA